MSNNFDYCAQSMRTLAVLRHLSIRRLGDKVCNLQQIEIYEIGMQNIQFATGGNFTVIEIIIFIFAQRSARI